MTAPSEAHHLVVKLLTLPVADAVWRSHRWSYEGDRWQELVLSLLSRVLSIPEVNVRDLTNRLRFLGLLDVAAWAAIGGRSKGPAPHDILVRGTLDLFEEPGVRRSEAVRAVPVINDT